MQWYFYVGMIATVCIAVFNLPQLIKVVKTKNTSGLSIWMLVLLILGDFCFTLQGIGMLAIKDISGGLPLLLANGIAFLMTLVLVLYKARSIYYSKLFNVTESEFCENFATYKTKIKMVKAEKAANKQQKKEAAANKSNEPAEPVKPADPVAL